LGGFFERLLFNPLLWLFDWRGRPVYSESIKRELSLGWMLGVCAAALLYLFSAGPTTVLFVVTPCLGAACLDLLVGITFDLDQRSKDIDQLQKHCNAVQQLQQHFEAVYVQQLRQAAAAGQAGGALPPHWSSLVEAIYWRVLHTLHEAYSANLDCSARLMGERRQQ